VQYVAAPRVSDASGKKVLVIELRSAVVGKDRNW
jgi:hypothetical protein